MTTLTAGYTSRGIAKLKVLPALLPEYSRLVHLRAPGQRVDAVIGWGLKPTSEKARRYAKRHSLSYVALEDGFLRSLGLGVEGFAPHSVLVDHEGIYYDASRPSELETLIREANFAEEELDRARNCMALIKHHRLSKYNHAPDSPLLPGDIPRVLVVDQTRGDASIEYGGACVQTFLDMLDEALSKHPDAEILVKVHPDVIAGKKQGHLLEAASKHPRCRLIGEDLNPWALFDAVDAVHVVTSQLGFEALMAGKPVTCHGMPFYAGWGLTDDRQQSTRRGISRSLKQLFTAAYLRYCRYANPYTNTPCTLEETIALIADQKRQRDRLAGRWQAGGFSRWKRGFVGDFLGPASRLTHHASAREAADAAEPGDNLLLWSTGVDSTMINQASARNLKLWRMEDGFIRSVGLGVDLARPLSLVIDRLGIYYDPGQASELEELLQGADFDKALLERAARLRERLVALKLSKYNVPGTGLPALPAGRPRILVPGQVESDASIRKGSRSIRTNTELLTRVRQDNPEALILYKPHPDVLTGARVGALDAQAKQLYDLDVGNVDIAELLETVDEVHTMSSLSGFEALLRGKRVTTYGMPFYAGWGLTTDHQTCPRRTRRLSLDALIAGTLILYPTYVEPRSHQLCNAETAVTLLEQYRQPHPGNHLLDNLLTWLYRRYRNIFIGRH